jgi:hypothetical protein
MSENLSQVEYELLCEALDDGFPDMLGTRNPKNRKNQGTIFGTNPLGEDLTFFMPYENAPSTFEGIALEHDVFARQGIYDTVDFSRDYFALNPFGFNLQKLKHFFDKQVASWQPLLLRRFNAYLETAECFPLENLMDEPGFPDVFSGVFNYNQWIENILVPYSKIWFEHEISDLIREALFNEDSFDDKDFFGNEDHSKSQSLKDWVLSKKMERHFLIGRMAEHYKWKFKYEHSIVQRNLQLELAGSGGGKSSSGKRIARLEALMQQIEALAQLSDVMAEERILAQAWDNASKAVHEMPKTPKVRFEYEVQLRSIEPFKTRFQAIFQKNA